MAAFLTTAAATATAAPITYDVRDLGALWNGGYSRAYGVNDHGHPVGYAENQSYRNEPALFTQDGPVILGSFGGSSGEALAINQCGQIVGWSERPDNAHHAFLFENGTLRDLGTFGGSYSRAVDINDSGWVVGFADYAYDPSGGPQRAAFLYRDGLMTALPPPAASTTYWEANAINTAGQVVGNGDGVALLWTDPGTRPVSIREATDLFSRAVDINDRGAVLGVRQRADYTMESFIYRNGHFQRLRGIEAVAFNDDGLVIGRSVAQGAPALYRNGRVVPVSDALGSGSPWEILELYGINDRGQIVGAGRSSATNYNVHAVILTPRRW